LAESLANELLENPNGCPVFVSVSPDIDAAAERISSARLVFSMESGPAHLATALDKPGVFILGGGHYGVFAPWGNPKRQHWIHEPLICYHCNWKCKFDEAKCVTEIPPSRIVTAMNSLLQP
jgi:ADP-heptose:LPS heptosyltransferase